MSISPLPLILVIPMLAYDSHQDAQLIYIYPSQSTLHYTILD